MSVPFEQNIHFISVRRMQLYITREGVPNGKKK